MPRLRLFPRDSFTPHLTTWAALALALLLLTLPLMRVDARAQSATDRSAAGDHAEIIAQGVASLAGDEMAWRLVEDTAEEIGEAAFEERALGFAIATDESLLTTDSPSGARTVLAPGEAVFTPEGAVQARASLADTDEPYLRIGLVDAEQATNGNGDEVRFAGDGFTAPEGSYELELVGVKLNDGDTTSIASDFPMLVIAADGDLSIGDAVLPEGEAIVIETQADLLAEDGAVRAYVARIGSEVPAGATAPVANESTPVIEDDAAGVGRIVVLTSLCPAEVTYEQAQDLSNGDPCFGGAAVEEMVVAITNTETGDAFESGVDPANATASFDGIPAGNYDVVFATGPGLGETVGNCGGQDGSADLQVVSFIASAVNLELPAEREYLCVTRTLQLGDDNGGAVSDEGVLSAIFYACPAGMTFATLDPAQCELITDGFDFGFQGENDLHLADAEYLEGNYVWYGLTINADSSSGTSYSPILYAYPNGYDAYAISTDGGEILLPHAGGYSLTADAPMYTVQVYFFSS